MHDTDISNFFHSNAHNSFNTNLLSKSIPLHLSSNVIILLKYGNACNFAYIILLIFSSISTLHVLYTHTVGNYIIM